VDLSISARHQRDEARVHGAAADGRTSHLLPLIEVRGPLMLAAHFITHTRRFTRPSKKRLTLPIFSWHGIVGCVGPTIAMPHVAVLAARRGPRANGHAGGVDAQPLPPPRHLAPQIL